MRVERAALQASRFCNFSIRYICLIVVPLARALHACVHLSRSWPATALLPAYLCLSHGLAAARGKRQGSPARLTLGTEISPVPAERTRLQGLDLCSSCLFCVYALGLACTRMLSACPRRHSHSCMLVRCSVVTIKRGLKTLVRSGLPAGPGAPGRPPSPSLPSLPPLPSPNWREEPSDCYCPGHCSRNLHAKCSCHSWRTLSHSKRRGLRPPIPCLRRPPPCRRSGHGQCCHIIACWICQCIITFACVPNLWHGPPHDSSVYSPLAPSPPPQPFGSPGSVCPASTSFLYALHFPLLFSDQCSHGAEGLKTRGGPGATLHTEKPAFGDATPRP